MATKSRRNRINLKDRMVCEPWRFDFFQLVRLIETDLLRSNRDNPQCLGDPGAPGRDPVRFRVNPNLIFGAGPVSEVSLSGTGDEADQDASSHNVSSRNVSSHEAGERHGQWLLTTNMMGLNGASGVLPFHYSELILARHREKDHALEAFLDQFNHRTISLFYKAWKKYRPMANFQSAQVSQSRYLNDWYGEVVKALSGMSGLPGSFHTHGGAWMNYPGAIAHRRCNEYTLKTAIYHQFGLRVRIHQFKGKWRRLSPDVVTRMAGAMTLGMNNRLGQNAILGSRCWVLQNLFEVEIEDFSEQDFVEFAPGTRKLSALYDFIKQRAGIEMDFDLSLMVREDRLRPTRLGCRDPQFQLGWNTSLYKADPTDKKVRIQLSKHGMQQVNLAINSNS
ncbi:MAG: type VI secretion system baseplate subunit TssG [Gammaproteobacteria bacterium]|nr:MAG: type VI secretion system baseplate subunit TssG [Pseudomonadota bacterium]PIE37974.1 MAG: type VI secretion system baseplate subunit TssG [Gammaproteobacteria bacterium]